MDYFFTILPKMDSFFLLMCIGILIAKIGVITKENITLFPPFIIKVVMPCLTFSLMIENGTTFAALADYGPVVAGQVLSYLFLMVLGWLSAKAFRMRYPLANMHRGCHVGGNYGFIGIPLLMVLFASGEGQQYIPVCAAVDTIFIWTIGILFFTYSKEGGMASGLRNLFNPVIISILLGLIVASLHIELPSFIGDTVSSVGDCSTPLALIYLGASLCFINLKSAAMLKEIFALVVVRMVLAPVAVYAVASHFLTGTETVLLTVICATPVMASMVSVAHQYRLDEEYASAAIFVTTVASLVTIPLVFFLTSFL